MDQQIESQLGHIRTLQAGLVVYSENMNNKHYEEKTPREREIDILISALHLHLEKHKRGIVGADRDNHPTAQEKLASKMMQVTGSLLQGQAPISEKMADEFGQALDLLDISHQAKNQAKTKLVKDKLAGIGG